jgi:ribonuclease BN (tRNA processing enzyme)
VGERLDLLFLGSGNAFASGRYWSSFILNERYLFDAAPTSLPHLKRAGIGLDEIECVFISHFHADHFVGLPFLILEYAEGTHRDRPLTVIGPPGVEQRLYHVADATFPNLMGRVRTYDLRFEEVCDGATGSIGALSYLAREVQHAESLECFGYRVELAGRTLAYSGDSTLCEPLVELATGADALVVECSYWAEPTPSHMGLEEVRELRRRLGPEPPFILTHLDAGEPNLDIPNAILATDHARLSL